MSQTLGKKTKRHGLKSATTGPLVDSDKWTFWSGLRFTTKADWVTDRKANMWDAGVVKEKARLLSNHYHRYKEAQYGEDAETDHDKGPYINLEAVATSPIALGPDSFAAVESANDPDGPPSRGINPASDLYLWVLDIPQPEYGGSSEQEKQWSEYFPALEARRDVGIFVSEQGVPGAGFFERGRDFRFSIEVLNCALGHLSWSVWIS